MCRRIIKCSFFFLLIHFTKTVLGMQQHSTAAIFSYH
uniref:Uncharacterized protein n=1 Tax=Anguilla anguilla TaxID=7936 RepID=A0A0E9UJ82_ANGAN